MDAAVRPALALREGVAGVRLLAFVLFGVPLALATIAEAGRGNPFAIGVVFAIAGPLSFVVAATALVRSMAPPLSRKADPAKIARLERELGIAERPRTMPEQRANDLADASRVRDEHRQAFVDAFMAAYEAAAPTTVAKPPADRNVEDCPRPEGCVIAHPCRKCGADRGQACVGDPYAATFHGAPTFGHKIEWP